MSIEELVNRAYTTWAHEKGTSWTDHMRAALTEQAETHAIELRAYEATVQNLEQRIKDLQLEMLANGEAQRVLDGMVIGDIAPAEHGAYLCMVQEKGATTVYPRVVWFGYYEYFVDETPTLSEGQTYNEDDAMVSGTGWHNEIEQFGGEYDFVTVTFNTNGDARIVNYSPAKLLPKPLPAAPAPKEEPRYD